jgi:hypothetical protein
LGKGDSQIICVANRNGGNRGKRGENAEAVAKELLLKRTSGPRNDFDRPIATQNHAPKEKAPLDGGA